MNEGALILIVEDELITARDIANTLEKFDYRVAGIVDSYEGAQTSIELTKPDLVIMDIRLGAGSDGIEMAARIRRTFDIPIIFLSGFADNQTLSRAKLSEPFGFISKPFRPAELYSSIETALYKHDMERRLRSAKDLLYNTLSALDEGVAAVDADGLIQFANAAAGRMLLGGGELAGRRIQELLDRGPDEERKLPLEISVQPLPQAEGPGGGKVYVLRSLREKLDARLARRALDAVVEFSEDAIFFVDIRGVVRTWNPGAARLFGLRRDEMVGRSLSATIPSFLPDRFPLILEQVKRSGRAANFEGVFQGRQNELFELSLTLSPVIGHSGEIEELTVIARDISSRKSMERSILDVSEKERMRIGQDLHDSLGQHLTGILLKVRASQKSGAGSQELAGIAEMLHQAVGQTRTLAKTLVPISLDTVGIIGAIRELAEYARKIHDVQAELALEAVELPKNTAIQLYRIAQEAVTNACKHSGTDRIGISLHTDVAEIALSVRDWGGGIDDSEAQGLGLKIMRYRSSIIGGHLEVFRHPEGGTQVTCRVPVAGG